VHAVEPQTHTNRRLVSSSTINESKVKKDPTGTTSILLVLLYWRKRKTMQERKAEQEKNTRLGFISERHFYYALVSAIIHIYQTQPHQVRPVQSPFGLSAYIMKTPMKPVILRVLYWPDPMTVTVPTYP